MLPHDEIRFLLGRARLEEDTAERDRKTVHLLSRALIEARRTGEATEEILGARFGFTPDELARHRTAALDRATAKWARMADYRGRAEDFFRRSQTAARQGFFVNARVYANVASAYWALVRDLEKGAAT